MPDQSQTFPTPNQSSEPKIKRFGKYTLKQVLLAVVFALIIASLIVSVVGGVYFFSNDRELPLNGNNPLIGNKKVNGKWVGIIATTQGLIKVNPESQENLSQPFLPPGFTTEFFKSLTSYDDNSREMFMNLLEDGTLVFRGSKEITTAPNPNTLYQWPISSTENPESLVEIKKDASVQSFAISPDNKQVAIISTTVEERVDKSTEEKLREELRSISIYDLGTSKLIKTIKLDLLKSPSRRTRAGKLLWNESGLFAFSQFSGITVFDVAKGKNIKNISGNSEEIIMSPDGLKYYNFKKLEVRTVLNDEILAKFKAPEFISPEQVNPKGNLKEQIIFVGPSSFSADSKKVLQVGGSVDGTNFIVWELNVESNSSKKFGDKVSLLPQNASNLNPPGLPGSVYNFTFIKYHPLGNKVLFSVFYGGIVDIFQIKSDEEKALLIKQPLQTSNLRDISFLGWYLSN